MGSGSSLFASKGNLCGPVLLCFYFYISLSSNSSICESFLKLLINLQNLSQIFSHKGPEKMNVVLSSFVPLFITFLIGIMFHLFPADDSVVKAFQIPAHKSSSSLVTRTATQTRSYQRKNIVPRAIHRTEFFGNTNEKLNPTLNFIPTTTCNNRMRYNIYIRNRNVFSKVPLIMI